MKENIGKREIERNPTTPNLNGRSVELLTKLCFRSDDPIAPVDLIFVFGWSLDPEALAKVTKELLDQEVSNKVFVGGGGSLYTDRQKVLNRAESFYILEAIEPKNYSNVIFYSEDKSRNTLENVTEALKVLDFRHYSSVLYISKTHDSQRCYLTLKKFLPDTNLVQRSIIPHYPNTEKALTAQTWSTYDFGRSRVWGEFLRIKTYGERGDIAYNQETRNLVEQIENLIT